MTASAGHGQQPTTDNEHLLTAPRVSLSPLDRVRFHILLCTHIHRFNDHFSCAVCPHGLGKEFRKNIFQAWKLVENSKGRGNSWKMMVMS